MISDSQNISKVFNSTNEELCCDAKSNVYNSTDRNSNAFDVDFESESYNKTDGQAYSKSCYENYGYLYSYSDDSATCTEYSNVTLDPAWKASRTFSILSPIFGGIGLVSLVCLCSLSFSSHMFLLASFSQSLTFLFFGSNGCAEFPEISFESNALITASLSEKSQLGSDAKLGIAAAALWLVCCLCCAPIGKYCDTILRLYSRTLRYICCENRRAVQKFIHKVENQVCVQHMNDNIENQVSANNNNISQDMGDVVKITETLQESVDHVVDRKSAQDFNDNKENQESV
jgi:hypothetical protein